MYLLNYRDVNLKKYLESISLNQDMHINVNACVSISKQGADQSDTIADVLNVGYGKKKKSKMNPKFFTSTTG